MKADEIDYQAIASVAKARAESYVYYSTRPYQEEKHQAEVYDFFYTVFQQLRRPNTEVSWKSMAALLTGFDQEEIELLPKIAVSCVVEQELERLQTIQADHKKYSALFYVVQKLITLWGMAKKHVETSDHEAQKKGFVTMQLMLSLCRETKRSILIGHVLEPVIGLQYVERFQKNWKKYFNEAAPDLKESRNYAAIIADILTFLPLILFQLGYYCYAGTWGMFSASKTFITANKVTGLVAELPTPRKSVMSRANMYNR